MSVSLGVDWAGDHWLSIEYGSHDTAPYPDPYESLGDLWADYDYGGKIDRLCIDIPIGLPTGPDERAVDKQCRSNLARTSSVFRVPLREALEADTQEEANNASRTSTRTEDTDGIGIQPPAYAIRQEILEVNDFIDQCEQITTDIIYEVHPELCFTAFCGSPPQYSKKTAHGVAERIEALDEVVNDASGLVGETLIAVKDQIDCYSEICVDDVLDALAAMYTAAGPDNEFHLLTGNTDATPSQRMAYRSSSELV